MTQTMTAQTLSQLSANQTLPMVATIAIRFAGVVTQWDARRRTRRQLKSLSYHQLTDIGVTREQARTEAARMFWRM